MTQDIQAIDSIPNAKPVRIFLPIHGEATRYRATCVYEKTEPPEFKLLFKPGVLPTDALDKDQTCLVSVDMGGPTVSIEAVIKEVIGSQALVMVVNKSISHEQMREFFRVDAVTSVISKSFSPAISGKKDEWSITGKTIDISGSGILATFEELPPMNQQVKLEITLPTNEPEVVTLLADPVRSYKVAENHYEVAYHFNDITTEDRDKIIGCCLIIQRQMLRLKVQVKDAIKI